jgi:cystathionine beta-lyase/cystathionine gamma-synthase
MNHFLREMNNQNRSAIQQQLCELDELYHAAQLSSYENALQKALMQVQQALPGFTIAHAEIYTMGSTLITAVITWRASAWLAVN